jgi:mannose/fructose/N-acetylgalactosamine-specific phosphotransferase system component IIC
VTPATVSLAAAAGGALCLERKTFAQFMLSRPIVVAPIIAAILGDVRTGFTLGIPLELVFLGSASYGASTPMHETFAALFAAALATAAGVTPRGPGDVMLSIAFFSSLPLALVGRRIEAAQERWNVALLDQVEEILSRGKTGRAARHALLSMLGTALLGISVTFLGVIAGLTIGSWPERLPHKLMQGLRYAWPLATGTSAALAIRSIKTPRGALLSAIAAAAVFVIGGFVAWRAG